MFPVYFSFLVGIALFLRRNCNMLSKERKIYLSASTWPIYSKIKRNAIHDYADGKNVSKVSLATQLVKPPKISKIVIGPHYLAIKVSY